MMLNRIKNQQTSSDISLSETETHTEINVKNLSV